MRQQINLYQPVFREARKLFSANVVGLGLAIVIAALLGIWSFADRQVDKLGAQVESLRKQQQDTETRISSLSALQGARANTSAIDEQIKALSAELAARTRALALLQSGELGATSGFASRLEALALGRVDGLWLDHVIIASGSGAMSLSGGTIDPDLVPRYLNNLATQEVLVGTRFDEFVIEGAGYAQTPQAPALKDQTQPHEADVKALRFRASSTTLKDERPGKKT